jgi:hypothetical protein
MQVRQVFRFYIVITMKLYYYVLLLMVSYNWKKYTKQWHYVYISSVLVNVSRNVWIEIKKGKIVHVHN